MHLNSGPIVVTGGNGFVGRHMIQRLRSIGVPRDQIVSVSNSDHARAERVESLRLDVRDLPSVKSAIAKLQPRAVIHLAAMANPGEVRNRVEEAWDVNFTGTRNLAYSILDAAPNATMVFSGSSEEYGESFSGTKAPVSEGTPLKPKTTYGATKAAADIMLNQMVFSGLKAVVFRSFNHSGPGQTPDYVLPAFAQQIALIELGLQDPVIKVGNLSAERDFLDVRDVTQAYALAALCDDLPKTNTFNLCSGKTRSIESMLHHLLTMTPVRVTVEIDPKKLRPVEVPRVCGNNNAIRRDFGWHPEIPLEKTLSDMLIYMRETVKHSQVNVAE